MTPFLRLLALTTFLGLMVLAGATLVPGVQAGDHGPGLPQAASPEDLARMMAKPPAGLEIVDIRPPSQYADYALPGSLNLDPATVLADETLLTGTGPLVIVDKDGTQAFAVAGVLARRASRQVLALTGGLAAWWADRELGMAVKEVPLTDSKGAAPGLAPGAAPPVGTLTPPPSDAKGRPGSPAAPSPAPPGSPNGSSEPSPTPVPTPAPGQAPQPPAAKNAGC